MKSFFKKKENIITLGSILIILILFLTLIILIVNRHVKEGYELDKFYAVYPEEIKLAYSYITDISCSGSFHFDIELDGEEYKVSNWSNEDKLKYTFSYVDKYLALYDDIKKDDIDNTINLLFEDKIISLKDIKNFQYDDYIYNYDGKQLKRKSNECSSELKYVSDLYGFSYTKDILSIDVNMGYEKDGILYDLSSNKLGNYSSRPSDLRKLFVNNSYYKYNYVNDGGTYKLYSVEWKSKI